MPSRLSLVNKTLALWLLSFLGSQQDENLKNMTTLKYDLDLGLTRKFVHNY